MRGDGSGGSEREREGDSRSGREDGRVEVAIISGFFLLRCWTGYVGAGESGADVKRLGRERLIREVEGPNLSCISDN